jgi:hypothetical protein
VWGSLGLLWLCQRLLPKGGMSASCATSAVCKMHNDGTLSIFGHR